MIDHEPLNLAPRVDSNSKTAADVMTRDPRTCSRFSRVIEAVLIFKDEDCGIVPVVEEGKPIGVVTDRDVALALATYEDLVNHPVSDIMSTGLISVHPEASLDEVARSFYREVVRRLLVVDSEGLLVGVIAWRDVFDELPSPVAGNVATTVVEAPSGT